jgi:hypothetical protein
MTTYWIDLGQPKLTFQIRDIDQKTMITPNKTNHKAQFSINSFLNDEIRKNSILKKITIE